jgi:ABC-type glutathione transport system ATPase component
MSIVNPAVINAQTENGDWAEKWMIQNAAALPSPCRCVIRSTRQPSNCFQITGYAATSFPEQESMDTLLEVKDLTKHFPIMRGFPRRVVGALRAVDGVSFTVQTGKTFGLVGENGCGKSTLGKTILGIYQPSSGEVRFQGQRLSGLSRAATHQVRREL